MHEFFTSGKYIQGKYIKKEFNAKQEDQHKKAKPGSDYWRENKLVYKHTGAYLLLNEKTYELVLRQFEHGLILNKYLAENTDERPVFKHEIDNLSEDLKEHFMLFNSYRKNKNKKNSDEPDIKEENIKPRVFDKPMELDENSITELLPSSKSRHIDYGLIRSINSKRQSSSTTIQGLPTAKRPKTTHVSTENAIPGFLHKQIVHLVWIYLIS